MDGAAGTFDLDVLRTFVAGMDLGSYARAASRLGLSTAAVSAQLRRLERRAGARLHRKAGRGLELTEAGMRLMAYARRLLELNDEAIVAVCRPELEGWIRVGLQEDFAQGLLPGALGRFARAHPRLSLEVLVARNAELTERIAAGRLDLAVVWGRSPGGRAEVLAEVPMRWIAGAQSAPPPARPGAEIALVAFEAPCAFRKAAVAALDRAGISWRISMVSASLPGLWAGASAGLGVCARTSLGLPPGVRALATGELGLPPLPSLPLALTWGRGRSAPAETLAGILREQLRALTAP
ncbi:MAG TPA: LysR substrate-binding domain-containing protein [Anaeromyxobacter sp.]|nr:LysR substrate-binding domain-containing protein [Anaeromyxobacter sp.]